MKWITPESVEAVADVIHQEWMHWSRSVAPEVSAARRERWEKLWVHYSELPEDIKELDRVWARRVLAAAADRVLEAQ